MKAKFFSLMVFFCLHISLSAHAEVIFRRASIHDLESILNVYRNFTDDDRKNLVTFPKEVDEKILRSDLENEKIFLSENDQTHEVLALLKLFIIKDSQAHEILRDELACAGPNKQQLLADRYDSNHVKDRRKFFETVSQVDPSDHRSRFDINLKRQVFIYYGGAYTSPEQRKTGLQSQLLSKSLEILQPELNAILQSFPVKKQIILVYGQVQANTKSKGMIHTFASFIKDRIDSNALVLPQGKKLILSGPIHHLGFRANKPSFQFHEDTQKLEVTFPEEGIGMSSAIILRMRRSI